MSLLLPETFQINNSICISKKIKNIPFFYLYFNPIITYHNLDNEFNIISSDTNLDKIKIKYKLVNLYFNDISMFDFSMTFSKSLYHCFVGSRILNQNHICVIIDKDSFIQSNNFTPILNNFSLSLDFKKINYNNLKSFFFIDYLYNQYIPIDIFIICYLVHNNISIFDIDVLNIILDKYVINKEKIEINYILPTLQLFLGYPTPQIIKYLFQFKYTWSYYSLISFFYTHYSQFLTKYHLHDLFLEYITSKPFERNQNIINKIHEIIFIV